MNMLTKGLGTLLVTLCLVACSNGDGGKSSRKTGTAVFFHNIQAAPELQLDAVDENDRNGYGTVSFEQFGTGVVLKPKTWSLEVVDERGTVETADDQSILSDQSFRIEADTMKIIALTGTYDTDLPDSADLRLHVLDVAEDEERDKYKNDDDYEQELVQFINFSHLHKDLGPVDIYLVHESHATDSLSLLTPVVSGLEFGDSSDAVRLEMLSTEYADYYLRIVLSSAPTVEIFNSGERRLEDYVKQTIILSPNLTGVGDSTLVAFYYGGGIAKKWFDKDDNIGAARVFNGLLDSLDLDVVADHVVNDGYDRSLASGLSFGEVSSFVTDMVADIDTYVVKATEGISAVSAMIPVDVGSAELWTVVLYGRVADAAGIPVLESLNASGSHASVTVTNAAYYEDEEDRVPFNVHIKKSSEELNSASVSISALDPGSYRNILKAKGTYQIYVTKENNNVIDYLSMDLEAYTHYHFVIVEDAASFSGYAIVPLPVIASP